MFSQTTLSPSAHPPAGKSGIYGMLLALLLVMLLAGCTGTSGDKDASLPPPLYPQPQTVELKAGVPIPATPKIIHPDSVAKPRSFAVDHAALTRIHAHPNRRQIPSELTTIPVDQSKLRTIPLGEGNPDFVLLSSTGDTIPTGVPVPAMGRVVQAIHSRPIRALPPSTKDAAIAHLQYLTVEQGLASSLVWAVLEDQSGNIWLGTFGGGVSVFNGESFTHYSVNEGLSNNRVTTIAEDQSGNIWLGTEGGGVSVYNGESFTHYTENEGLSNNFVFSIAEDQSGNIWLGTWGGGVSLFNGESFTHYTVKEGLSSNFVFSILEDQSGNIWLGTGGGVSVFNGDSFTHYTVNEGLSDNRVWSILEDLNGNIWLGTRGGVSVFNGESFTHYTVNEGLSFNVVNCILEDKHGNIWVTTEGGGVSVFNGESFTHYTETEGLPTNTVRAIAEDKHGNIWLGNWGGGVSVFNSESFTHYTVNEGLSNNNVTTIVEDQSGNIWAGTLGGGVSVYDGESFTHYTSIEGLFNNAVMSILEDQNGHIWLGTWWGVSVYDGESFTHYGVNEGLSSNNVWTIIEDESGNIWLGTEGGVSVFNGESFTHYTVNEGLSHNSVVSILEDQNGHIWLGTDGGGVSVYNGESFTHYGVNEGLSSNSVWSILEDQNGHIWLGTLDGGVNLFNGESFTHYTVNEGLSHNSVISIVEDKNAPLHETRVFIGTGNGLSKISLFEEATSGDTEFAFSIQNFGKQDGLKGLDFRLGAMIDSKNRAWWGAGSGLVMQDLNTLTFSNKIPQPRLTQLDINEQFIDYRTILASSESPDSYREGNRIKFDGVQNFENYPLGLQLPYDNNHLTFHFAAIDWAAPHKIRYSYRMGGLDTNWSQPTANPVADYRNLPFGTYTLQIRAIGESGVWSEPFEYTFTILPPWWQTWWAYGIYALLFLAGLRTFSLWRERRLRQEKEQLQVKVGERTVELKKKSEELEHSLEELKSTQSQLIQQEKLASLGQLTAGIAHEIKNPLNFVNNFSEVSDEMIEELIEALNKGDIDESLALSKDIGANLKKIHEHGSRANGIVQSMLMHSRGGSGKMEPTDLNALIKEYVNLSFHGMRAGKEAINVDIDLQLHESVGEVPLIAEDFSRVILNLCNNAFDAMRERVTSKDLQGFENLGGLEPKLTIRTKSENGQILIEVQDNGPGIPDEIKDKILQPFFTTKKGTQGTGLGLSISNDIIKAHGGSLDIESGAKGSIFKIFLPK